MWRWWEGSERGGGVVGDPVPVPETVTVPEGDPAPGPVWIVWPA